MYNDSKWNLWVPMYIYTSLNMLYISCPDNQQCHCYNHCTDLSNGNNTSNGICPVILAYHTKDNIYIPKEIQMLQRLTDPPKYGSFPIINSLVISELYRIQENMIWISQSWYRGSVISSWYGICLIFLHNKYVALYIYN